MSLCNGVPGWVAASSPGWPCPPPHPCAGPGPLAPALGLGRGVILLQGLPACCAGFVLVLMTVSLWQEDKVRRSAKDASSGSTQSDQGPGGGQ